jgi:heme-degrading monooxygenase HmoA
MLSATFIFAPGTYDDEFHRLDAIIMAVAEANEGYKGCERWWNEDRTQRSVVYYFDSPEALRTFSTDETHKQAKREYARWYEGYRVVIAEVLSTHTAGTLEHPLNQYAAL